MNNESDNHLLFLAGGGEMGERTRNKDWTTTSLGHPETWPQSLRTTLSIILNSRFPMFLWWGTDHICFYNDAYRPSLGENGKHPAILGMKGKDAWPEIWETVLPMIDQVLQQGDSTYDEERLIPIERNGQLEDVYWTFSYSPVNDESGKPAGVFVTCLEATKNVVTRKQLEENERRSSALIQSAPVGIAIFKGPDFVLDTANHLILSMWGRTDEILNASAFQVTPTLIPVNARQAMANIYKTRKGFAGTGLPIAVLRKGLEEIIYVNFSCEPLYQNDGTIDSIMVVASDITEQISAFKRLEISEEKLNIVIAASELATWELDLETREPTYSNRYLEILGYPKATMLTHPKVLQHIHPDDLPTRNLAHSVALKTGILQYEARIVWNDGSIHWIEAKGKVLYDQEQEPVRMIGTLRDITSEKNYQNDLKEREQKFRLLADSIPQHIWTVDPEGKLNYFNLFVFEYSGLTPAQTMQGGWLDAIHPDDRKENQLLWSESLRTGQPFVMELRLKSRTGDYRWHVSQATPQKNEHGKIVMWVGTSTDIEKQKTSTRLMEAEVRDRTQRLAELNLELRQSEERYHRMVEEVQDYAILYLNREGVIENWNVGAEAIKGYSSAEIIGKNFSIFYTPEDRLSNLPKTLLRIAANEGRAVQEGWRVKKDGSLFWASVVITAVHNTNNEVVGFSKVTHDLTEKKAAADLLLQNASELLKRNEELNKMNKELEAFAYISSHDLQEPLRKIQTFATRIADKEYHNLSDYGKDYFLRMQNAAKRMQALIDDLLAYSRTNTADRKFEKIDLNIVVKEISADLTEELQAKNASIVLDMEGPIDIIPFQFRQLLYNLISNSLKFSVPERPPKIEIRSRFGKSNEFTQPGLSAAYEYCHICVSDNGIGFEQQYGLKIFDLFQRLHARSNFTGTGIGLAIVKKIVENHDGIIVASGQPNKGATFDIYIPLIDRSSNRQT